MSPEQQAFLYLQQAELAMVQIQAKQGDVLIQHLANQICAIRIRLEQILNTRESSH